MPENSNLQWTYYRGGLHSDVVATLPSSTLDTFCASAKHNSSPNTFSTDSAGLISNDGDCGRGRATELAAQAEVERIAAECEKFPTKPTSIERVRFIKKCSSHSLLPKFYDEEKKCATVPSPEYSFWKISPASNFNWNGEIVIAIRPGCSAEGCTAGQGSGNPRARARIQDNKGCWYYADELGIGYQDLPRTGHSTHDDQDTNDNEQWRKCEDRYDRFLSGKEKNVFIQPMFLRNYRPKTLSPPTLPHTHKDYEVQWKLYLNKQKELANPEEGREERKEKYGRGGWVEGRSKTGSDSKDCDYVNRQGGTCVRMQCLSTSGAAGKGIDDDICIPTQSNLISSTALRRCG